ncbi:MAG: thiamine-phosphate kinase [Nitrospira sp. CG24D]|nr:MAG: thiamine-phosphate kinase [Nitrospira sp. CG24D]
MARRKATQPIQEFPLIRQLQHRHERRSPSVITGIGDDAAVVSIAAADWVILTTDLLTEGIHFDLATASLSAIGYKAAMANLSDVAAMGASPRFLLVSIAIPSSLRTTDILALYDGLMTACRPYNVRLVGGDTSASQHGLFLSITLLGTTERKKVLLRKGARIGDSLYVTGTLGDSLAGLQLLSNSHAQGTGTSRLRPADQKFLINRHLRPTARVREGQWLNQTGVVTSAIDVSDGLSGDLRHICNASHVGAEIDVSCLPLSPACQAYGTSTKQDPVVLALAGGEDYELLFTVPEIHRARLERTASQHNFSLTRIGHICAAPLGIHRRLGNGRRKPLPVMSYEHFRTPS